MSLPDGLLTGDVEQLLVDVGRRELVARLPHGPATAREKAPGEVVTEADLAAERALTAGLARITPSAVIVGEEAAHADGHLLDDLAGPEWLWVVDPLDGTRQFAQGIGPFGIQMALLHRGRAAASWIHLPLEEVTAHARAGEGAFLDGTRLHVRPAPSGRLTGGLMTRFFPADARARAEALPDLDRTDPLHHCAAQRYVDLARGLEHVAAYWRTLPWDHAPGALLVTEAGGVVARFDGRDYDPSDRDGTGLLVAADPATWRRVRDGLFPPE